MDIYTLLIIVILSIILLVALSMIGLAYAAASKLLKPPRRRGGWKPSDLGFKYDDLVVETKDGLKLRGWIIYGGGDRTVMVLHGYTSSKYDEGYMKPVIEILARNGFNVVAFDFRAHGDSDGELTTLGFREVDDVVRVIDWIEENKPGLVGRLGLIGYSMGGAVALMVSARDERVKAVVADSPYIDIVSSGRRWIMRLKGFMRTILLAVYPLIVRFAEGKAGIKTDDLRIMKYADKIKQPVLIIAGKRDDLVSLDEVKGFYTTLKHHNRNVELWIVDTGHVDAVKDYPREYEEKMVSFLDKNI